MDQQMQNQTNFMETPPHIITVKDSLYLADMLSWNLLAMKKAHFFASQCQDPELINALEKCGQMHQRHYEKILNHLNMNHQNQGLQS
jgi:hypothetical protein